MTRDEASVLFERVYLQLSQYPYGKSIPPEHSEYLFEQPRIDIPQE